MVALAAAFLALPLTLSARGQDLGYFPGYDPGTLMGMEAIRYAAEVGARSNETPNKGAASKGKASGKSSLRPAKTLVYTPSRARTRANVAAFAMKMKAKDPQGAAAMTRLFATKDVMGDLGAAIKPLGLATNNVADAYALWWATAWLASEGIGEAPTRAQLQGVKAQVSRVLLAAPEIARMDDAKKQTFAEAFLIQAMLVDASLDAAREDASLMEPLRAVVAKGAKATGLDFATMRLTNAGFRAR